MWALSLKEVSMRLKHIEKNIYVDLDTGEEIRGDPGELNIKVVYYTNTIIHFGKYVGKTIRQIWFEDENYIKWMKKVGFNVVLNNMDDTQKKKKETNRQKKRRKKREKMNRPDNSVKTYPDVMLTEKGLENGFDVFERVLKNQLDSKMFDKHPEIFDDEDVPWD